MDGVEVDLRRMRREITMIEFLGHVYIKRVFDGGTIQFVRFTSVLSSSPQFPEFRDVVHDRIIAFVLSSYRL